MTLRSVANGGWRTVAGGAGALFLGGLIGLLMIRGRTANVPTLSVAGLLMLLGLLLFIAGFGVLLLTTIAEARGYDIDKTMEEMHRIRAEQRMPTDAADACILGWLAWAVMDENGAPAMHSILTADEPWIAQQAIARELAEGGGVHALKDKIQAERLADAMWHRGVASAVGSVALWGTVVEHERGWRAEHAYPVSIDEAYSVEAGTDNDALARRINRTYACVGIEERAEAIAS